MNLYKIIWGCQSIHSLGLTIRRGCSWSKLVVGTVTCIAVFKEKEDEIVWWILLGRSHVELITKSSGHRWKRPFRGLKLGRDASVTRRFAYIKTTLIMYMIQETFSSRFNIVHLNWTHFQATKTPSYNFAQISILWNIWDFLFVRALACPYCMSAKQFIEPCDLNEPRGQRDGRLRKDSRWKGVARLTMIL